MAYYPKNKIQQNLQTDGTIYKTIPNYNNDGPFYSGYYYKLYDGKTYTGKYPGDGLNEELISTDDPTLPPPPKSINTSNIPPLYPTPSDYKLGVFTRYFSVKRNQAIFEEISSDQYKLFQQRKPGIPWSSHKVFLVSWELTGDKDKVGRTNKNIVELTEQKEQVLGLGLYLKEDYLKYYK